MLKVGTILRGTYRIDSYLSSGGFGNTYVATNIEFEERVAIKEFFMKGVTQRDENQTTVSVSNAENHNSFLEQKEKFKKEARRLRKLNNEYIVSVHDLFEENGTAYYVMDYVDGENLAERLKRTGKPMTEQEVREILPQILDALKSVHDAGIWHLDLKPANIMVDRSGHVKLIDFGASKQLNSQKGGATTSTAISYTNGYAPREQMEQNYDKFGPWTDIYALGATLFSLLTNKQPPLPTDIDDDMSEDKRLSLPFADSISKETKDMILLMMHTNRNQRPQNVESIMYSLSDVSQKDIEDCDSPNEETLLASNDSDDITLDTLIQLAENGDVEAQYNLALIYYRGDGIEEDKKEAFEWFEKAARQGDSDAQFYLAFSYMNGEGIEENKGEAFRWYKKSAERGNISAQNNLACCYDNGDGVEKDKEKAFKWFKKAAEQGDAVAQNNLGNCYDNGDGVEKNEERAFEWYKKSAEQGYADAQYNLACFYDNGKGVKENKEKAFEWYKKSAEQENADAQYNVALCYDNGIGIDEDKQEALEWYKKAAEQNNGDAIKVLMPLFRKALRKRHFYIWKGITIFASWFSAYVYLFIAVAVIGMILSWIEKISEIIGVNIRISMDSLNFMPIIIPILFVSLFVLSLLSMFLLLPFSSNKQRNIYWKVVRDSGIIIPYDKVDNGPYFMTCW